MADVLNPMPGMEVAVDADMPSAKVEITVQGDALPAGGNAGDVLTRTENGAEWKEISAGADGYTPVKGVDYYTDADKDEIVQAVMSALPAAEGVSY